MVSRGAGRSAVAASAYLSRSRMLNDYDGVQHDYTRKQGLAWQAVFLPPMAPPEWQDICPSQRIPEDILIEKTKEVLAVDELDRDTLLTKVQQIIVPAHNRLQYLLADGTVVDAEWRH